MDNTQEAIDKVLALAEGDEVYIPGTGLCFRIDAAEVKVSPHAREGELDGRVLDKDCYFVSFSELREPGFEW